MRPRYVSCNALAGEAAESTGLSVAIDRLPSLPKTESVPRSNAPAITARASPLGPDRQVLVQLPLAGGPLVCMGRLASVLGRQGHAVGFALVLLDSYATHTEAMQQPQPSPPRGGRVSWAIGHWRPASSSPSLRQNPSSCLLRKRERKPRTLRRIPGPFLWAYRLYGGHFALQRLMQITVFS
jgi:hypothetical protein